MMKDNNSKKNMKLDVLLVFAPMWPPNHPYLAPASLAGTLRDNGFNTEVIDFNILSFIRAKEEGDRKKFWDPNEWFHWMREDLFKTHVSGFMSEYYKIILKEVLEKQPEYVGFTVLCSNKIVTFELITMIRKFSPETKILVGGHEIKERSAKSMVSANFVDAAFVGEGEESLIKYLKGDQEKEIPGVAFKSKDEVLYHPKKFVNLSGISIASFEDYDLSLYTSDNVLPMYFTKGCVARCNFCKESRDFNKFRQRTIESIVDEMEELKNKYNVTHFACVDTLMNGNPTMLKLTCDEIIRRDLKTSWGGNCRFEHSLTRELLEKMRRAGCSYITLGLESASQKVLDLMEKDVDIKDVKRVLPIARELGIEIVVSLIVGYPGEEEEDFQETLDFVDDFHQDLRAVGFAQPLMINPGTMLWEKYSRDEIDIDIDNSGMWKLRDNSNTPEIRLNRYYRLLEKLRKYKLRDPFITWTSIDG